MASHRRSFGDCATFTTAKSKHFGQAHGTPFTVPPLSTALQFTGEGPGTEDILTGAWDFQGLEENVA